MQERSSKAQRGSLPPTRQTRPTWQAAVLVALCLAMPAWLGGTLLEQLILD